MKQIIMQPIGKIRSPYEQGKDVPIQGILNSRAEAWIELKEKYTDGLRDLDGFSHAIILYYFHKSDREEIEAAPFLEPQKHGIFAIRSPHRPNHIGFSIVKIEKIKANKMYFTQVDMLDGTPVLDIKPYVKYFDSRDDVRCGWLDKHLKSGNIPERIVSKGQIDSEGIADSVDS